MSRKTCVCVGLVLTLFLAMDAGGQMMRRIFRGGPAEPGMVNLPYMAQDNTGNNYRIYGGGWFQQNNNMPLYSQGAMLNINGQQVGQNSNQAKLDGKTGELIFENLPSNGCTVTRRVVVDKATGYIRYIDIIKNTQAQQQTFQVTIQSSCNYGINAGQNVPDQKKKDLNLGWVGQTGANQSVVEMYAGRGSKVAPTINWPPGNNVVQATYALTIGPNKEAAVMHLHLVQPNQDAGAKFINDLKESPIIKSIPPAIRRLIVNFRAGQDFIGDLEILRGEALDVVELRSGDEFKGTLKETGYTLQTFYGAITLPVDKVVALINVGQFRPRQLLVTVDGQILGGQLKKQTIDLEMSSGQVTQIPLSQVTRMGYRKRVDEPQEWTFEKPMLLLRSGDRVNIQMPTAPLEVITRYGRLSLKPAEIGWVSLQNEDNQVHEVQLVDGSRFAGLLTADGFDVKLDTGGAEQTVRFPASTVAKIQMSAKVREPDDMTPTIHLANEDELSGTLVGKLKLDTAFDAIEVNTPELKSLSHAADGGAADVQAVLWDGTTLSGQLENQEVVCQLLGGLTLKVPVALIQEYNQPQPQPSAAMVENIKKIVQTDLGNEDWHVRDRARTQLLSMGPAVASVLKQMRDSQPPEAQKTIDVVLSELEKQRKAQNTPGAAAPAPIIDQ